MLQAVNKAGGLAIAFNANEYALKYATMSLASVRLDDVFDGSVSLGGRRTPGCGKNGQRETESWRDSE